MEYWIIVNGDKVGPLTTEQLAAYNITPTTMVWHRGMTDWLPARDVADMHTFISPSYAPGIADQQQYRNPYGGSQPLCPPNYLAWSIVVTLLCCQISGIIAIIYASMVESRYRRGDYDGAVSASKTAKGWVIASVVIGALGIIIYLLLIGIGLMGTTLFGL